MENIKRIIILDWAVFVHRAIFALKFNPNIPATYTAQSMILSSLARVGVEPDDIILFACDGRKSWRKEFEEQYKANRKEHREESGIDFTYWFEQFNILRERLNNQTNWLFIGPIDNIEADDIMAVACRYFKTVPEIVLITIDSDWEQAWAIHPNVKIYSLITKKWKIKPDDYNVYAELAKKVNKEASDNLVTSVTTSEEYDKRLMCVDLTRLPEWVENSIVEALSNPDLYSKNIQNEKMPSKSLQSRLDNIYNDKSKLVDYTVQIVKAEKKAERIKKKKIEAKLKIQKQKERAEKRIEKLKLHAEKFAKKQLKGVKNGNVQASSI